MRLGMWANSLDNQASLCRWEDWERGYHISFYVITVIAGKSKCFAKTGDCVVKHPSTFATGMGLVVSCMIVYCICREGRCTADSSSHFSNT